MAKANDGRLWSMAQAKEFVKQAKSRVGELGWGYLSREQREGLVARQFSMVVIGSARDDVPAKGMQMLYRDMLEIAGLLD
ncbi:hypothetical protein ABIC83_002774 [Roseateles asaccharophilus]|uniref:hypothetical protein n=1 Tax=Roseateles asaccharophilus TaxID=582607 RepID=UPI0038357416